MLPQVNQIVTDKNIELRDLLDGLFPKKKIEKVLLITPPDASSDLFNIDTALRGRYANYSPYGLGLIAQNLRNIDVNVEILNLNHHILKTYRASKDPESLVFDEIWQQHLDTTLDTYQPDLVGVTCMFTMTHASLKNVCSHISKKKYPISIGGVHVTNDVDRVLDDIPEASLAFTHEGDIAIKSFCKVVEGKLPIDQLSQVVIVNKGKKVHFSNINRPDNEDLNIIPAYDLMSLDKLSEEGVMGNFYGFKPKGTRFATALSNRGCRAKCSFCSVRNFNGMGVRQRSVSSVLDELEMLQNEHGVGHVVWLDDDLLMDQKRALNLFDGMVKRNLKLTWDATNGVIASSCTEEVVASMEASGCIALNIGMESGNPKILRDVKKPGGVKHFLKAAENLKKYEKIHSRVFLMIGFPGETLRMINDTINVAREMDLDWCGTTVLQPLPNTPIYDSMVEQGLIQDVGSSEVRFNSGGFGKQNEIERGDRWASQSFEHNFGSIGMDGIPDKAQLNDIWFYMNYHLNFHRLFSEERPLKIEQQFKNLQTLCDIISPEHCFSLYFIGYLQSKLFGNIDNEIVERLDKKIKTSDFWKDRFNAFGLSVDDLKNNDFKNKNIIRIKPGQIPKDQESSEDWV
jgi:radical SAM superfamily enzyme YgiQ (UPF0313 family)